MRPSDGRGLGWNTPKRQGHGWGPTNHAHAETSSQQCAVMLKLYLHGPDGMLEPLIL